MGRRLELGVNTYRVRVPPTSITSLLASSCSSSPDGIGRHVVTESGPRPSTWPAAWPWSSVVSCQYRPFG